MYGIWYSYLILIIFSNKSLSGTTTMGQSGPEINDWRGYLS